MKVRPAILIDPDRKHGFAAARARCEAQHVGPGIGAAIAPCLVLSVPSLCYRHSVNGEVTQCRRPTPIAVPAQATEDRCRRDCVEATLAHDRTRTSPRSTDEPAKRDDTETASNDWPLQDQEGFPQPLPRASLRLLFRLGRPSLTKTARASTTRATCILPLRTRFDLALRCDGDFANTRCPDAGDPGRRWCRNHGRDSRTAR